MPDAFFDQVSRYESGPSWQLVLLCMLLSFVLCQVVAAVYVWTHRGLSYSRSFVVSLVMGGVVTAMLLLAIGNNVARGLGLVGTLSLIRFRATLKDTRDIIFIFCTLGVGVAVGVQAFTVAVVGALAFSVLSLHLGLSPFGSRRQFDGLLRFQAPSDPDADDLVKKILRDYCNTYVLINLREIVEACAPQAPIPDNLRNTLLNVG